MGDFQQHPACVIRRQEPWHAGGQNHRVAHQYILTGLTHGGFRPHHGHQAHGAVKFRQVKFGLNHAIRTNLQRAGKKRYQVFGRGRAGHAFGQWPITARPDLPIGPLRAVNQTAIDIAHIHAQFTLAEIIIRRVG